MTASAMIGDREKCLAADRDGYISLEELEEVLERRVPERVRTAESQEAGEVQLQTGRAIP